MVVAAVVVVSAAEVVVAAAAVVVAAAAVVVVVVCAFAICATSAESMNGTIIIVFDARLKLKICLNHHNGRNF